MEMIVSPTGNVRFVYSDALADLIRELGGEVRGGRASFVEPDEDWNWLVDLSPVSGPQLGPFKLRETALAVEREWLSQHEVPVP